MPRRASRSPLLSGHSGAARPRSPRLHGALTVIALVGCGHRATSNDPVPAAAGGSAAGSDAGQSSDPAHDAGSGAGSVIETLAATPPTVTLVGAGAEPRRAFAYAPHSGDHHANLSVTISMDGAPADFGLGLDLALAMHAPPDSSHPYELAVTGATGRFPPSAQGGERQAMAAIVAVYAGRTARIAADAQGRGTLVRTSGIVPMKPSLLWLIHPWIVPVPGEAIGVGATWHVTQPLTMAAAQGELERTYQVTATQGDTLTLKVTGVTHWHAAGTAAGSGSDEAIEGTLVVGRGDVLARSGQVTSIQDLGPAKAKVQLALTL